MERGDIDRESGSHRRTRDREREREKEKERGKRERAWWKERDKGRKRRVRSDDIGEEEVDDAMESDRKPRTKDDKENVERDGERSRSRSDRHWDGQVDSPVKKSDEDDLFMKEKKPTEELEDEQKKLDEEMEKRRRRVQQWLEFIRKKKEAEGEKARGSRC
ncbi:hypothetical protein ACFX11_024204 [Malus domestica]